MSNRPRITFDLDHADYDRMVKLIPINMRSKMLRGFMRFILPQINILTIDNVNKIEQGDFTCLIKNQQEKECGNPRAIAQTEKQDTPQQQVIRDMFERNSFI